MHKKLYRWLRTPARDNQVLFMEFFSSVAKWSIGVGGVTLAVAISFSGSMYASFTQVYDKCQVRLIASDAILTGRTFGLLALFGALFALLGLAWPRIAKQVWFDFHIGRAHKNGHSAPQLTDWHPSTITALLHFIFIFGGLCAVAAVPLTALSVIRRQTPEGLLQYVQSVDIKCAEIIWI